MRTLLHPLRFVWLRRGFIRSCGARSQCRGDQAGRYIVQARNPRLSKRDSPPPDAARNAASRGGYWFDSKPASTKRTKSLGAEIGSKTGSHVYMEFWALKNPCEGRACRAAGRLGASANGLIWATGKLQPGDSPDVHGLRVNDRQSGFGADCSEF